MAVSHDAIAIVGMACRFPGADTLDEYWQMLCSGKSMHSRVPPDRFSQGDHWRLGSAKPQFWGNFLDNPGAFDNDFFGLSSREAASMDPQQRLALHVAYEAVESAGYFDLSTESRSIGVFLGVGSVDYQDNVSSNPANAYSALGTLRAFISGRISHHFGWTGPSITYDTSCSSSAVAIHSACKAILSGECSAALAGGVNVITSPLLYEDLSKSGFLSPTGPCKPFDAKADGYCRGEGAGMLYLKKLSTATTDNEPVLGIIAASAINQGENSTPITVPHMTSQTSLYRQVLDIAALEARQIGFVEAHGTGTPVGDPIEFESIRQVFGKKRDNTLYVGSVKANIGHIEAASGIAAAIKAVLMIQYSTVPQQANFMELNPKITLLQPDRMDIPRQNQALLGDAVFVNNYGAAGSNAAFIICRPRPCQVAEEASLERDVNSRKYPIILTSHSKPSLRKYCEMLRNVLTEGSSSKFQNINLPDLGFATSRRTNQSLPFIFTTSVSSLPELGTALMDPEPSISEAISSKERKNISVILCFGGQSKKSIGLSKTVYNDCTLLRMYLDSCELVCRSLGVLGFYPQIFDGSDVSDIVLMHCMLFSIQYACAKAWIESGLLVDALIGHSFGHLTALCVSDVLSLEEALRLIIERANLIKTLWGPEKGVMLSVESSSDQISNLKDLTTSAGSARHVEIACYNGPDSHVLVGSTKDIEVIEEAISAGQTTESSSRMRCRRLDVTHGFHSYLMDPIMPNLAAFTDNLNYRKSKIHVETCTKSPSWPLDAATTVQHSREPVYFHQAVERLATRGPCTWVEAGTDSGIMNLARNAVSPLAGCDHTFHPITLTKAHSMDSLADTTVKLWRAGAQVQFWPYHRVQRPQYRDLKLPSYQFDKRSYWLKLQEDTKPQCSTPGPSVPPKILSLFSFIRPQNEQRSLAEFRVDTNSPRFRTCVEGHKVLGYSSCPASVYLHLVGQALVQLVEKDSSELSTDSEFLIENLVMPAPLRNDYERMVTVEADSYDDCPNRWSFRILSRSMEDISCAVTHARGVVCLQTAVQDGVVNDRFRFTQSTKCDVDQNIAGPFIYNVFSTVVEYADVFKGVKNVTADAHRVVGRVLLPESQDSFAMSLVCEPFLIDNFLQVAGLYVNCLAGNAAEKVFVCSHILQFQYQDDLEDHGVVPWDVIVHINSMTEREVVCDIMAYPIASKVAGVRFIGVRFAGISRESLKMTLSRLHYRNETIPSGEIVEAKAKACETPKHDPLENANEPPQTETRTECDKSIFSRLQQSLSEITGVATSDMQEDSQFGDVGIDSLAIIEVLDELENVFAVNISLSEFEQLKDLKSLARHIELRTTKLHSAVSSSTSID